MRVLVLRPKAEPAHMPALEAPRATDLQIRETKAKLTSLLVARLHGGAVLHLVAGCDLSKENLRTALRASRWLRMRLVWTIQALPSKGQAVQVENLRSLFHAARVRIVQSEEDKTRLSESFGLSGTTFVIPQDISTEDAADALRLAYETALEPRMPVQDRARPPRS